MTSSTRCAICKYFRRRCRSDCIFAPYFPANNPHRFACIHKIYGTSNLGKLLEKLRVQQRVDAVELYYEAKCRIQDLVYGCVGIISSLHQQIQIAETQLALAQAEIAIVKANVAVAEPTTRLDELLVSVQRNDVDHGLDNPSNPWFY